MRLHGAPEDVIATIRSVSEAARPLWESIEIDVPLADGDLLGELRVHMRPGHSPTDTIFVHEREGWALVADHLLAHTSPTAIAHRPIAAAPASRPPALLDYLASLERTARLGLGTAYPGHGPVVTEPAAVVPRRIDNHLARARGVLAQLREGSRTAWDVVEALYGGAGAVEGHPLAEAYLYLSDVLGHLDLLVADGRARVVDPAVYEPV
jgi:glyoxylase-like metal-dependent hydrolase (beta-lactamase superfamily II)